MIQWGFEAERKRGLIKKSRHAALVEEIDLAAQEAGQNVLSLGQQIEQAKNKTKAIKSDHDQLKRIMINYWKK